MKMMMMVPHLVLLLLLSSVRALQMETVIGQFGQTLEIPCHGGDFRADNAFMVKWKYDKGEGLSGDLLVKPKNNNMSVIAAGEYSGRVSMESNCSLLLSDVTLSDQKTFTCMVVAEDNIAERAVAVVVYKAPTNLEISDKAQEPEIGKMTQLGTCVAKEANPAATISWLKNGRALSTEDSGVSIRSSVQVDPITGLSTTFSTLEISATKADAEAEFSCSTKHESGAELQSPSVTFTITYSTENIALEVLHGDLWVEGDNLTLKCVADGNPAPTSFFFYLKDEVVKVENSNTFTVTNVSRANSGEYKCSLIDDPTLEASENVIVNYLDVALEPSGQIVKTADEALNVTLQIDASEESVISTSWTKDNVKLNKEPDFSKLAFSDSGHYEVEVTMGPMSRMVSFELQVKGPAVIKNLSKQRSEDGQHKVLICEAEGSPKPEVSWSVNGTATEESSFNSGKITHKLRVVPSTNLSVSCTVINQFGSDSRSINVSSLFVEVRLDKTDQSEGKDQTKVVVGVVVGVLVATLVIALVYWIYMRRSKQGSWRTGETDEGSTDDEKKLEEKVQEKSPLAEA